MNRIHFVCRDRLNVSAVKHPVYESGVWDLKEEDAQRLVGGLLYLHQTKAESSYFGGKIESFRIIETEHAHSKRIIFTLTSLDAARGVAWSGADHGNAWTSGVVADD